MLHIVLKKVKRIKDTNTEINYGKTNLQDFNSVNIELANEL